MPARFAPEGINVKEAHQTFKTVSAGSFNVFAGALGTNRLRHLEYLPCLVFSRSHSGRENSENQRGEQGGLRVRALPLFFSCGTSKADDMRAVTNNIRQRGGGTNDRTYTHEF